jgi:hypothetical protein
MKKTKEAVPYLLYAERHGEPQSLSYLYMIAKAEKYHNKVSKEIRDQLLSNLPPPELYKIFYNFYQRNFKENINTIQRQSRSSLSHFISMGKGYMSAWQHKKDHSMRGISSKDFLLEEDPNLTSVTHYLNESLVPLLSQEEDKTKID